MGKKSMVPRGVEKSKDPNFRKVSDKEAAKSKNHMKFRGKLNRIKPKKKRRKVNKLITKK